MDSDSPDDQMPTSDVLVDLVVDLSAMNLRLRKAGDELADALLVGGNVEKADAVRNWREVTGLVARG